MHYYRNNLLFWTDVYENSLFIWRSNLHNGSDAVPLIDTGASTVHYRYGQLSNEIRIIQLNLLNSVVNTVSIAVDWITDKIYWTNNSQIMVYDLHSGYVTTVLNSTEPGTIFHQVVVDPGTRQNDRTIALLRLPQLILVYTYFSQYTLLE